MCPHHLSENTVQERGFTIQPLTAVNLRATAQEPRYQDDVLSDNFVEQTKRCHRRLAAQPIKTFGQQQITPGICPDRTSSRNCFSAPTARFFPRKPLMPRSR